MVEVLVEYDYLAKEPDELTIKKGDVIRDVVKKTGGWWEGILNDKKGLFPDNFVRLVDKDASVVYRNKKDSQRIRQCRVVFSYKQDNPDELNLNVGDVINILGEEEEGWWRGVLNGKEGVFPSNFVEEIKSKPGSKEDLTNVADILKSPTLPPKPTKTLCQVKYSYKSQNEDELTLKEGDIINILSKEGQDPGWWKGELNGEIGFFPDNFVVIIPHDEKINKDDYKLLKLNEKVPVVSAHRKSLDEKQEKTENHVAKSSPPVPSKKPQIPLKKSPSGSSSHGGLLAGLKKKIVDVVDGASSSKSQPILIKSSEIKDDKDELVLENAFDQVERTPVLQDVRATRAKAPGRRPPSVIFKDGDLGIPNGNSEHIQPEQLSEHSANSRSPTANSDTSEEIKPKVREWEKHKAPWLEEMKLNQAKRTSTSPGPPEHNKLKFISSDKLPSPEIEDTPSTNKMSPFEQPSSPVDMSKSMSSIEKSSVNLRNKTPNEIEKTSINLRNKQPSPQSSIRVQSSPIASTSSINEVSVSQKQSNQLIGSNLKTSTPVVHVNKVQKITTVEKNTNSHDVEIVQESISFDRYKELLDRIEKLESMMNLQEQTHKAVIEDLQNKLQVEIDKRMLLQVEVDKISQCVLQV